MSENSVLTILNTRARIFKKIRAFFDACNYLEVDTPLLAYSSNTDVHIQSITAQVNQRVMYLQTSPEFAMKRLLVDGSGSIFQLCPAFRDEEAGRRHQAEFTLLEWYSVGFDYLQLMDQVAELIHYITGKDMVFEKISYRDCFQKYLDLDIDKASDQQLRQQVEKYIAGIETQLLERDDCLDLLISEVISKQFDGYTFVYDYPASQASLARLKPDNPAVAERFELFYRDMELANGFSELTDANEQRARFDRDNEIRKQLDLPLYPLDEAFLQALEQGLPECAGVAVGIERLLMVLLEKEHIDQVSVF